jgi:hypothetical protein
MSWLLGALLFAAPAAAQGDASETFAKGRDRWEAKDYQAALPLFREALSASSSPNARFYVARCLRDLGQLAEAYEEMSRTVRDARALAVDEERYAATRDAAAAELAVLEGRIGKVVVALDESLADATVELNGVTLPPARVGELVAVMPGTVAVIARRPDGTQVEKSVSVGAGMTKTVTLLAATADPARTAPTTSAPTPDEGESDGGGGFGAVRAAGIGVALVGVAGFVTFGVGSVIADKKLSTLETSCGDGPCTDPALSGVIDEGKRAELIGNIGLGIGIAGVLAGAAMIIFGGSDSSDTVGIQTGPNGTTTLHVRF